MLTTWETLYGITIVSEAIQALELRKTYLPLTFKKYALESRVFLPCSYFFFLSIQKITFTGTHVSKINKW